MEKVPGFGQLLCWLLCGLRQPLREERGRGLNTEHPVFKADEKSYQQPQKLNC